MRLKAFLATYFLFLFILYSSLGIVSAYMTSNQTEILKEKSTGEYYSIAATLAKDIAVLHGRYANLGDIDVSQSVNTLVDGYISYYRKYNIKIAVTDLSLPDNNSYASVNTTISFVRKEQGYFIHITGTLPEPFQFYQLNYDLDITKNVMDMRNTQNILLLFAVIFSVVTAIALRIVLSSIFKPLSIVANTSRKIADGQYSERIRIKGKHEISSMAQSFNLMAEQIEKQIHYLEEEAIARQQFADNLAHEMRTPLTSIYGYAEYIQRSYLQEEEIIESAQYIMDEAGHMNKIANSLLELATLRNYMPIKNEISIPRLFGDISRSMEYLLQKQNICLDCHNTVDVLFGQEDLIKSLLVNLCLNAMKACVPGVGAIHLVAEKQDDGIVISVSDNGCGIPKESISHITEPFYRVDKARSREDGGAGLGLAICKQIIEAHNADMIIESSVGVGTMVKITFTSS